MKFCGPNFAQIGHKIRKGRVGFFYVTTQNMTITKAIFKKLKPALQIYVLSTYTVFHENMANDLVADIRSQTDGRTGMISI
jgi:hypothetical protein